MCTLSSLCWACSLTLCFCYTWAVSQWGFSYIWVCLFLEIAILKEHAYVKQKCFILKDSQINLGFLVASSICIKRSVEIWLPGYLNLARRSTPVLLPGKSHGRRSLVGRSPWGREELDTTERLHSHFSLSCIGEGNGNPLQCSCLENPRGGGAWWAAVYGVARSRTRLSDLAASAAGPALD